MKCKVVKVAVFGFQGKDKPGDIVEVPKRFTTLDFLELIPEPEKPKKKQPS